MSGSGRRVEAARLAGGVVFRESRGAFQVLLLPPVGASGWRLPRRTVEREETPGLTALRAAREETGVRALLGPFVEQVEMALPGRGPRARADYFLLHHLVEPAVADGGQWFTLDEATGRVAGEEHEVLVRSRVILNAPGAAIRLLPPFLAHVLDALPPPTLAALAETEPWAEEDLYAILAVPSEQGDDFLARLRDMHLLGAIDDGDELSVLVPEADLIARPTLLEHASQAERSYHFIRLEATLPWNTVGYGAAIFAVLAAAGISAGFYSGYSIDYLLVSDADAPAALAALRVLTRQAAALLKPG